MNRELVDELLGDIRRRFYIEADARAFYAHRRWLLKAITWPAAWLRKHGFDSEVTPAAYRKLLAGVFADIARHGDWRAANYFPSYLLKCLQDHCRCNADAVLYDFKLLRNRVDFSSIAKAFQSSQPKEPTLVDALAQAHELLVAPKRGLAGGRARSETDVQLSLL